MGLYKKLYILLFHGITDAIASLERQEFEEAKQRLIRAQQAAEEVFMESESVPEEEEPIGARGL